MVLDMLHNRDTVYLKTNKTKEERIQKKIAEKKNNLLSSMINTTSTSYENE